MKHFITAACILLSVASAGSSEKAVDKDSLLKDFDLFIEYLEETHPDPYSAFGGRPHFFKASKEARMSFANEPEPSARKLASVIASLTSTLKDGHTYISAPDPGNRTASDLYPIFQAVQANDSLWLSKTLDDDKGLLGSRIISISGLSVEEASEMMGRIKPTENRFGAWSGISDYYYPISVWKEWLPSIADSPQLVLATPAGDTVTYNVPLRKISPDNPIGRHTSGIDSEASLPRGFMEYKTVDDAGKVMMIKLQSVNSRENLMYACRNGMDFHDQMKWLYQNLLHSEMPVDTLQAINAFPSFPHTFRNMLLKMKSEKIPFLIIDLRGNGGGWTPIVHPTAYQMFGDDYFTKQSGNETDFRRISRLFLKKMNASVDELNHNWGTDLKTGDYFYFKNGSNPSSEAGKLKAIRGMMADDEMRDLMLDQNGTPVYRPERIFVVTDPSTFSAAFHYAFLLWKLGAEIVGVTSSQAPNTFMEVTPFILPYSGISGSISNYQQNLLPPDHPLAKEFTPDHPISYGDFKRHGFNKDTPILCILEMLK